MTILWTSRVLQNHHSLHSLPDSTCTEHLELDVLKLISPWKFSIGLVKRHRAHILMYMGGPPGDRLQELLFHQVLGMVGGYCQNT